MICAVIMSQAHLHAPTDVQMDAFVKDLNEAFQRAVDQVKQLHPEVEIVVDEDDEDTNG